MGLFLSEKDELTSLLIVYFAVVFGYDESSDILKYTIIHLWELISISAISLK